MCKDIFFFLFKLYLGTVKFPVGQPADNIKKLPWIWKPHFKVSFLQFMYCLCFSNIDLTLGLFQHSSFSVHILP